MSDNPRRIPLSEPLLGGNERAYIEECIQSNFVSSVGPFVDRFEHAVANYVGAGYGVAVVNGTAALHVALLVAGVGVDDEVLVSDLTFVAPANAVRYVGAWPVFIDAEPEYFEMDPGRVIDFLEKECRWSNGELRNRTTGRRVRAIIPVHVLGHPCDIGPIVDAVRKYDLTVIEDATESLGAKYKGRMVGTLADMACFSFNGNKIITTGGGGMLVTDNEKWARRAKYLTTQAKDDPVEYVHNEIGYNYRLTNIQAAMGVAQMEQLPHFVERKREIARLYEDLLGDLPGIRLMGQAHWAFSNFWLYTVRIDAEKFGMDSRGLMTALKRDNVESRPLWRPLHMLPPHRNSQHFLSGVSESLYRDALSIPCSVGLSRDDVTAVARCVARLHSKTPVS
ncbi:MAG TPA: LegC family aminotransferase [Thermoanaerobaculia bacterium]|nr:LegC family aminotransferase [Thermoanaerobaculia bacterium]